MNGTRRLYDGREGVGRGDGRRKSVGSVVILVIDPFSVKYTTTLTRNIHMRWLWIGFKILNVLGISKERLLYYILFIFEVYNSKI